MGDVRPQLGDIPAEKALRVATGAISTIPGIGAIMSSIISELIPNTRADRLEDFVRQIDQEVKDLKILLKPEALDLFEEGGRQAAQAYTEDRKKHIQKLVTGGLNGDQEIAESRHYLRLLGQLGDDEIALLADEVVWFRDHPFGSNSENEDRRAAFTEIEKSKRQYLASFGLLKAHGTMGEGNFAEGPTETGINLIRYIGLET